MSAQYSSCWEGSRVGFVLFVSLVVLVAGLYIVAFRPSVVGDMVEYKAVFSETEGLRTSAPVWIGGVEVGSVSAIDFASEEQLKQYGKGIIITLSIGRKYINRIRVDSVCIIKSRGLLGELIIAIKAGSYQKENILPGGVIPTKEGEGIAETIASVGTGFDRTSTAVVLTLEELRKIFVDIREKRGLLGKMIYSDDFYNDTFKRIDKIANGITDDIGGLSKKVNNEISGFRSDISKVVNDLDKEITLTTKDLRETSSKLREELESAGKILKEINGGKGSANMILRDKEFAGTFKHLLENLDKNMSSLRSIMEKIDKGDGTVGKLVNDSSAYLSLRDLFEGVQESWLLSASVKSAEETGREMRIKREAQEDKTKTGIKTESKTRSKKEK